MAPVRTGRSSFGMDSFLGRSSLTNSELGSPLANFVEEDGVRINEDYQDKDVWGTRIILSALEDIVFSETAYPKLSPAIKEAWQKFLLGVNTATNVNSFADSEKSESLQKDRNRSRRSFADNTANPVKDKFQQGTWEIPKEVVRTLLEIPEDCKIVLRTLISSYVRKVALNILELWKPIIESRGGTFPLASSIPRAKKVPVVETTLTLTDYDLPECLKLIVDELRACSKESQELDCKLKDLLKKREEEAAKYERDTNTLNQVIVAVLNENAVKEEQEFISNYLDILNLENKVLEEQLRLEQLKVESENTVGEDDDGIQSMYQKAMALYKLLENETQEMEEQIQQYKKLDPEYLKLLDEFNNVEEDIKTKEWVRDQLRNGPQDDSLLLSDDSFCNK